MANWTFEDWVDGKSMAAILILVKIVPIKVKVEVRFRSVPTRHNALPISTQETGAEGRL